MYLPDVLRVVTPATSYIGSPVPRGRLAGRGEGVRDLQTIEQHWNQPLCICGEHGMCLRRAGKFKTASCTAAFRKLERIH